MHLTPGRSWHVFLTGGRFIDCARTFRSATALLSVLGGLALLVGCHRNGPAAAAAVCTEDQLLAFAPGKAEVASHRHFTVPTIRYPYGEKFPESSEDGNFRVTIKVDALGKVSCLDLDDRIGRAQPLTDARRRTLAAVPGWRYAPFTQDGHAVGAIVVEEITEEKLPSRHVTLPDVPLSQVRISLQRSHCYGTCPAYSVEVRGDGSAIYNGGDYVGVEGEHRYVVPVEAVARLVDQLRSGDLWSLEPEYRAGVTDNPTFVVTMDMGGQVHKILDYVGRWVGMPAAVVDFEESIDRVGRSNEWLHISEFALQRLKAEGFGFHTDEGVALLARAVTDEESHNDAAIQQLIELGVPVNTDMSPQTSHALGSGSILDEALRHQHGDLVDPLIARGQLKDHGQTSQLKLDRAFRAAIAGGRLAPVETLWNAGGPGQRPSLWFDDATDDLKPKHKQAPVTLSLGRSYFQKDNWEGMAIAQWLAARGCDLKATGVDGRTLLHIAADAGDAAMVRYLLGQGLSVSTPGRFGLPALGSAHDEDVVLALLEAGSDLASVERDGYSLRKQAVDQHWMHVAQWLDTHHVWWKR